MTNYCVHDPAAHKLSYVGLRIGVDIQNGVTKVEHVAGHSNTFKGALFYISNPCGTWKWSEEPNHLSIATLEAQSVLDEIVTHLPNTDSRAAFVLDGGLRGHGMEPLF